MERGGYCCFPSETYGRKGGDSNFQFFVELPVPLQAVGVVGTLNCCTFSLYNAGILSTTGDPGMSLNCVPTRVCRKSASRPGYVVKVRTDPGYVVKQCPRIVMNKIFDWH